MPKIPRIGDTHTELCCLYFSPQWGELSMKSPPWKTPGPEFVAVCEPFEVTATVTLNPVAGVVECFEQAKREALADYTKTVARINEQQARFLAIENALADTVEE